MAADNSATGYRDSRGMKSVMQKDQHTPVRPAVLSLFICFPPNQRDIYAQTVCKNCQKFTLKQSKVKFDSVFFQRTARGHGAKRPGISMLIIHAPPSETWRDVISEYAQIPPTPPPLSS